MTRIELLQDEKKAQEIARHICDTISDKVDCNDCPFTDRCYSGHNGVLDYLTEEVQYDD